MILRRFLIALLFAAPAAAQTPVEVVSVISRAADRQVRLPGEFLPYLSVAIHAKVTGFVDKVEVDRGSVVKRGQLLATLVAPEMKAQLAEAESKAQAIELQKAGAGARLAAAESTYQRLKAASATPGAVAENDVILAEKTMEAIAQITGGRHFKVQDADSLLQVCGEIDRLEAQEIQSFQYRRYFEAYPLVGLMSFSFLALVGLLELTVFRKIP